MQPYSASNGEEGIAYPAATSIETLRANVQASWASDRVEVSHSGVMDT